MNKLIASISLPYHDRSISVLNDGILVDFIIEDRISRNKYDNKFPLLSLQTLKDKYPEINTILISQVGDDFNPGDPLIEAIKKLNIKYNKLITLPVSEHHSLHASAGFYSSGFEEAGILVIDGHGGLDTIKHIEKFGIYLQKIILFRIIYLININKKRTNGLQPLI